MFPISVGLSVIGESSIIWSEFGIQVTSDYEKIVEWDLLNSASKSGIKINYVFLGGRVVGAVHTDYSGLGVSL